MYTHACIHTFTHEDSRIHAHTCTRTHICTHTHNHEDWRRTQTHLHAHTHMYTHTSAHTHTHNHSQRLEEDLLGKILICGRRSQQHLWRERECVCDTERVTEGETDRGRERESQRERRVCELNGKFIDNAQSCEHISGSEMHQTHPTCPQYTLN